MMAGPSNTHSEGPLSKFSASLEDLTFNSKPIIDDLTRFAGVYRQFAPQIAQKIEERILEVRPEWKLPSLYLLDSILKNIKGDYLVVFSKIIVRVFCHCFEKLVDADSRKALFKLRQTWPQYFANRKLALIDKHVKAIDPNWPVTATEEDPPSPTIFVNPKFLEPDDNTVGRESPPPTERVVSVPSPKKTTSSVNHDAKQSTEDSVTIQEKRKQLLRQKQSQRMKQQEAMGLSPERHRSKKTKRTSPHPPGPPGVAPLKVPPSKVRARSASPLTVSEKSASTVRANHSQESISHKEEVTPPPEKRPKLISKGSEPAPSKPESKEPAAKGRGDSPSDDSTSRVEPRPIKESQLQLDDLPPELLPKHHELILKQIEAQLSSGNLTSEQHSTLCKQLNQLYELQKLKEDEDSRAKSLSPKRQPPEQTDKRHEDSIPSQEFISLPDSTLFVDARSRNDNFEFGPSQGGRHDYHDRPRPHFEPPPEDRYYSRRPPAPYRDNHRPPFRSRRGPYPPRGPRGCRYFDEYDGPPPGRGHMIRGPPPPHWQEPPPPQGGADFGMGPGPPPPVNVSSLFNQLVDLGMIEETGGQAPPTIPTLSFTVGTLKQRYGSLISLLHTGEQCSTCGIRFPDLTSDEYRQHLDWHYSLNRNEGHTSTSRNWFIHPEDWLKFEELSEESQEQESSLKPSAEVQEEEEVKALSSSKAVNSCQVLPGESNEVCNLCHEPLEQFWEEDLEEWHFKDATRSSTGKLYHTFCFQDAKEEDLLHNQQGPETKC